MSLEEFCRNLPKVELHAHLNGSLSKSTLLKLGVPQDLLKGYEMINVNEDSKEKLKEVFNLFKVAHNAINIVESVYKATKYTIEEFYQDNVIYLELRTSPKQTEHMTKEEYIEAVIRAICDDENPITVKLLLSINREHDLETSQESLEIILKMHQTYPEIIRGIDLSGNPHIGKFNEEIFVKARNHGLAVTLHCAEIRNDKETDQLLKFRPDRIGHGTCIHPNYGGSNDLWKLYQSLCIPLECCLTSNVLCETSRSYSDHHIKEWIKHRLPFSINTDDKGVFSTNLSKEYLQTAKHFNLNELSLIDCSLMAIKLSFAADKEKIRLTNCILKWKNERLFK